MPDLEIKEYLSRIGIRRINELDTALVEAFGREEGEGHIVRLTELFDQSEERLLYGAGDTVYLHRQFSCQLLCHGQGIRRYLQPGKGAVRMPQRKKAGQDSIPAAHVEDIP